MLAAAAFRALMTLALLTSTLAIAPVEAQQNVQPDAIDWNGAEGFSDSYMRNGVRVYLFVHDSISFSVSLFRQANYMQAKFVFINGGSQRFELEPAAIELWSSDGRKPILRKMIPAEQIARSINRRAEWGAAFQQLGAALATEEVVTTTNATASATTTVPGSYSTINGTGTATSTSVSRKPDQVARLRAEREADALLANASTNAGRILEFALRSETLFTGDEAFGYVYFEKDSKTRQFTLLVPIGRISVRIPISLQ